MLVNLLPLSVIELKGDREVRFQFGNKLQFNIST